MSDHHRDSSDKASYDRRSSMTYERRSDFDGSGESEGGGKIRGQAPSNRARDSFARDNRGPQHGGGGGYYGNNQAGFHRGFAPVIPMGAPRGGKFVGPYGPMHAPVGGAYNRQMSASHQRQFPPSHGFAPHHPRAHHPMAHYGHQQHSRNQNNKDADNGGPLQSRQSGDGLGNMRDGQRDTGFGGDRRDSNTNFESRDGFSNDNRDGFHGNNSEGKGSGGTNNPGSSPGKGAHSGSNNNGSATGGSDKKDGGGGSGGTGSVSGYGLDRRDSASYASAKDSSSTSGTGKGTGGALDRRDTYGGMGGAMDRRELFSSNSTGNNGPMMDSNSSTSSINTHGGANQADHQAQDALTAQQQMQQQQHQHQHQNPGAGVYGGPMNSGQGAMGRLQSQHSRGMAMGMVRGGVGMGVGSINSYNAMGGDPSMQQLQYTNSQPNIMGPGGAMPNSHLMSAHRGQQPLVYQTSGPMRGSVHDSPNRNGMAGMGRGPGGKRPPQGPGQGTTPAMIAQEQQRLRLEEEIQASGAADHLADWGTEELEKKSEECRMQYRQTFTKERELTGKLHIASENYYAARLVSDCCDIRRNGLEQQIKDIESTEVRAVG